MKLIANRRNAASNAAGRQYDFVIRSIGED